MNQMKTKINVKIPQQYAKKKYIRAIGMGLFDLARGERPESDSIEMGTQISVRIRLSPKAAEFWEFLLPKYDNNQRRLAREALHLVSLAPEHCLRCRI